MRERQSNTQFLTELMEFARSGPLMQAFVLEAIAQYAERCLSVQHDEQLGNLLISGLAWRACAEEAKFRLNQHLSN